MVGVNLDKQPDDHPRTTSWYMEGRRRQDALFSRSNMGGGVFVKPWDYTIIGSAVGDSPWTDFEGVLVETP
ncbi:MAG: hypothetical protein ACREBU_01335 [Nitrososphaera sp.]